MGGFRPIVTREGYLPIEDHGLIGDGRGCALVGRDGCVSFMCVPRFDSPPLFCRLLDRDRGGCFLIAPEGTLESHQWYVPDTGVLCTALRTNDGEVRVTDAFTLHAHARLEQDVRVGRGELVRQVHVRRGNVGLRLLLRPHGDARMRRDAHGWRMHCPRQGIVLWLRSSHPLDGTDTTISLEQGEQLWIVLGWRDAPLSDVGPPERIAQTVSAWRSWTSRILDDVPNPDLVRRSAITLKLLDHVENGAIVAAATSSLPERIGGVRNWDYRYSWIRDAAYAVFALRRVGLSGEAEGFLRWVLDAARRREHPRVLYDITGRPPPAERIDAELAGYRGSAPVRWGNAAAEQIQHDVYGEILDCAYQWNAVGGTLDGRLWDQLAALAESARTAWTSPDHGIWEVRTPTRPFTYSAAMCQVALDRAARLSRRLGLPGDATGWAAEARLLARRILTTAWNDRIGALTEHLGPDGDVDASLLALPLRRVVPADHPRMIATTQAITERLTAGEGLLFRYRPEISPDGLPGHEGAFLLCSFWLADNLAGQGRLEEANRLFERLCAYPNALGLLPEQIDPSDGSFLGNFPQGLSHVGLISTAVTLARIRRGERPELSTRVRFD